LELLHTLLLHDRRIHHCLLRLLLLHDRCIHHCMLCLLLLHDRCIHHCMLCLLLLLVLVEQHLLLDSSRSHQLLGGLQALLQRLQDGKGKGKGRRDHRAVSSAMQRAEETREGWQYLNSCAMQTHAPPCKPMPRFPVEVGIH
jgi:hypothetical protein